MLQPHRPHTIYLAHILIIWKKVGWEKQQKAVTPASTLREMSLGKEIRCYIRGGILSWILDPMGKWRIQLKLAILLYQC